MSIWNELLWLYLHNWYLLGAVAQMYFQVETGIGDNTIPSRKKICIQDLSKDNALTHFYFYLVQTARRSWQARGIASNLP